MVLNLLEAISPPFFVLGVIRLTISPDMHQKIKYIKKPRNNI